MKLVLGLISNDRRSEILLSLDKLSEYGLSANDGIFLLELLDIINSSSDKRNFNNTEYSWVYYKEISDTFLSVKDFCLKAISNRIKKFIKLGFLKQEVLPSLEGNKSFISITPLFYSLIHNNQK